MTAAYFNADIVIEQIDRGTLRPMAHAVARALLDNIGLQHQIITAYDKREPLEPERASGPLWTEINALPLDQQGALRLISVLAQPDSALDWYAAEFFILWARQQGLSDEQIVDAFGCVRDVR